MTRSGRELRRTLQLTGHYLEGNRRPLVFVVVAAAVSGFAEAIVLVVVARLAFALASTGSEVALSVGPFGEVDVAIETLVVIALALVAVDMGLQVAGVRTRSRLVANVSRKYKTRLVRSFLNSTWSLQSGERSGRLQEMVGSFVGTVAVAASTLATGLVALTSLVALILTAVAVNVFAAFAVALAALGLGLMLRPLRKASRRVSRRAAEANLAVATDVAEATQHLVEVRIFGVEDAITDRLGERVRDASAFDARKGFLNGLVPIVYQGTALFLLVLAVAVLYAANVSHLGAVGGVILIMLRSLSYGQALQSAYQSLHAAAPPLEVLRDELARYDAAVPDRSGSTLASIGELSFDRVSFEYAPGLPVLHDVSFTVPHGEIIGVVGPSGAGKSTLVQILLRLRDPVEGRVLVDGRDATSSSLDDWYRRLSYVPQDAALFAGSIADNIRFFRDDVDEAAVERAAKLANLHGEVMAWPLGYETQVGERGGELSGGQRQRLCIARALAEEPDLIVFDESTSSLDVRSESLVRDAMAGLAPKATVFVIAHRLSTLTICDRIMVLFDGRLEGFDEPEQLEQTNPFYRETLVLAGLR